MEKEYKKVFTEHILDTEPESRIILRDIFIVKIPEEVHIALNEIRNFSAPDVYISTKSLKHAYDRRSEFVVENLDSIYDVFKNPDRVIEGRVGQRAHFIFLKWLAQDKFLTCPVEICKKDKASVLFCVTFFPARTPYIKKSTVLWSREGGAIPPS